MHVNLAVANAWCTARRAASIGPFWLPATQPLLVGLLDPVSVFVRLLLVRVCHCQPINSLVLCPVLYVHVQSGQLS
jgi:hypothetical protein